MARKQTTIVRCDRAGCKEVAEVLDTNEAAPGWLLVFTENNHKYVQRPLAFEFCGERCLSRWATERAKYQKESPEVNPPSNGRGETEHLSLPPETPEPPKGDIREAILIVGEGKTFTSREVQELSGRVQSQVDTMLRQMVDSGEIVVAEERPGPFPRSYALA